MSCIGGVLAVRSTVSPVYFCIGGLTGCGINGEPALVAFSALVVFCWVSWVLACRVAPGVLMLTMHMSWQLDDRRSTTFWALNVATMH